jgi:hypothetical protein
MIVLSSFGFPSNIFKICVMGMTWFRAFSEEFVMGKCTKLNAQVRKMPMLDLHFFEGVSRLNKMQGCKG